MFLLPPLSASSIADDAAATASCVATASCIDNCLSSFNVAVNHRPDESFSTLSAMNHTELQHENIKVGGCPHPLRWTESRCWG
ncbi:hypothetical protein C1H46_011291 [Malus baccata]|uniref:Uncharacterized protein n=1 Tax=Malus baccata TaxID=106549 RepID=A0A540MXP7_MALBA|nr:hypothetical protein C1H46_011291 [Malus baccata]